MKKTFFFDHPVARLFICTYPVDQQSGRCILTPALALHRCNFVPAKTPRASLDRCSSRLTAVNKTRRRPSSGTHLVPRVFLGRPLRMFYQGVDEKKLAKCYVTHGRLPAEIDPKQPPTKRQPFAAPASIAFTHTVSSIIDY